MLGFGQGVLFTSVAKRVFVLKADVVQMFWVPTRFRNARQQRVYSEAQGAPEGAFLKPLGPKTSKESLISETRFPFLGNGGPEKPVGIPLGRLSVPALSRCNISADLENQSWLELLSAHCKTRVALMRVSPSEQPTEKGATAIPLLPKRAKQRS